MSVNPDAGVLFLDPAQLQYAGIGRVSNLPHWREPAWYIGTAQNVPDNVQCLGSIDELYTMLRENEQIPVPDVAQCAGSEEVQKELNKITDERLAEQNKIMDELKEYYANWAWPKDRPPRVFSYCTRFSSVMQWSARGLLSGFAKNNCETRFFQEDSAISRVTYGNEKGAMFLPLARAVNDLKPDLWVSMNFYRHTNPVASVLPIPVLTWIQDRLSNLSRNYAQQIKPNDFIAIHCRGFIDKWVAEGFPISQIQFLPWGYDSDSFYPPTEDVKREGIVYIEQNAALSPEQAYAKFRDEHIPAGKHIPRFPQMLDTLWDRASSVFATGVDFNEYDLEATWADICEENRNALRQSNQDEGGFVMPVSLRRNLLWRFGHDVTNRFYRQRPLVAISRAGLPLKIYGKGWENHPILARHAAGELKGLEQIRDVYQKAQVVLSLQHETGLIHRTVEGLACGAHVVCNELVSDNERASAHIAVATFKRPDEIVPLLAGNEQFPGLLKIAPPPIEATNIQNLEYKNLADGMLQWINERMTAQ